MRQCVYRVPTVTDLGNESRRKTGSSRQMRVSIPATHLYRLRRCKKCKGKQTTKEKKAVDLNIDPGMRHKQRIVLKGEGDQQVSDLHCERRNGRSLRNILTTNPAHITNSPASKPATSCSSSNSNPTQRSPKPQGTSPPTPAHPPTSSSPSA